MRNVYANRDNHSALLVEANVLWTQQEIPTTVHNHEKGQECILIPRWPDYEVCRDADVIGAPAGVELE